MIISAISDRLGNQMFQYAAAKGLAIKQNTDLKIDKRYYDQNAPEGYFYGLGAFHIPQLFASNSEIREYTGLSNSIIHKAIRKVYNKHQLNNDNYIYDERFFHYDEDLNKLGDKVYLRGYWQSYKYFSGIKDVIRTEFGFKFPIDVKQDAFAQQILQSNAVCISIRRGDHLWHPVTSKKYGHCNIEYYNKGLEIINAHENNLTLFIFSDDIEWCMQNIKFDYLTVFVKHQFTSPRFDYYLQLITLCKHFIIPVSTFPWWGAWLSNNENKIVIAPKVWFTDPAINTDDLFPDNWIRI
jgi:hypothetical protein